MKLNYETGVTCWALVYYASIMLDDLHANGYIYIYIVQNHVGVIATSLPDSNH